ncbi:MAG: hypothetical protein R2932_60245 [Caldilineaceae bacterium]
MPTNAPTVVSLGTHIVDILGRHVTQIPDGQNVDILDEIRITVAGTAAGTSIDLAKLGAYVGYGPTEHESGNFVSTRCRATASIRPIWCAKKNVQTSATMLPFIPFGPMANGLLHVPGCANHELRFEDLNLEAIKNADYSYLGGTGLMRRPLTAAGSTEFAKAHDGVTTTFDLVAIPRPDLLELTSRCCPILTTLCPVWKRPNMCGLRPASGHRFFPRPRCRHNRLQNGRRGQQHSQS